MRSHRGPDRTVTGTYRDSAGRIQSLLLDARATPAVFRAALDDVPYTERDVWLDAVLGLDGIPDDGPELPRGCVPYLPCSVDTILRMVEHAGVQASDVMIDVGSGVGRAAALVHLLTGASVIGLEIQPALVRASRDLAERLKLARFSTIEGDAAQLTGLMTSASLFFLYCPFSGDRLEKVLDDLEPIAQTRQIRVCSVDLPLPPRAWLEAMTPPSGDLAIYRSTLLDEAGG